MAYTVRELITALLNWNMDALVTVSTDFIEDIEVVDVDGLWSTGVIIKTNLDINDLDLDKMGLQEKEES